MMNKMMRILFAFALTFTLLTSGYVVNAVPIVVDGVKQGTDDKTYAKDAPLADIIIDFSVISDLNNAEPKLLSNYEGFRIESNDEINSKTHTTDYLTSFNSPCLVYDESISGATKITGSTGSMNTFEGKIASFTYKNAALLPDGTKGKVVITYSNISFPMQTNFGKHRDTDKYTAKVDGKYSDFFTNANTKMKGNLKQGKKFTDFWEYDSTNDKGNYLQPGLYTVGYGNVLYSWNNLVRDAMNNSNDYGFTTRNGIKLDAEIQVLDSKDKVVDGTFMYTMTDIDTSRANNNNFAQLYDYNNQNYYSETVRIDSGIEIDSEIYIPGDIEGDANKQYKYTEVYNDGIGTVFRGVTGEKDPGSTYSGFVTVFDNNYGAKLTYWASGAQSATIKTFLLHGNEFHSIFSYSSKGGKIETTEKGNASGNLDDGSVVISSGEYDIGDGKTVVYTFEPDKGYNLKTVVIDGKTVTIPEKEGDSISIKLNGPSGEERTGVLKKLADGKYSFTFPDNNYNHDIHVYWQANKYPITYTLNGGKNNSSNPSEYTVEDEITIKNPTRKGYKFLGWKEGNKIKKGSTGAKHFTAQWEKDSGKKDPSDDKDKKDSSKESGIPETGDNISLYMWCFLISSIGTTCGGIYLYKKNRRVYFTK